MPRSRPIRLYLMIYTVSLAPRAQEYVPVSAAREPSLSETDVQVPKAKGPRRAMLAQPEFYHATHTAGVDRRPELFDGIEIRGVRWIKVQQRASILNRREDTSLLFTVLRCVVENKHAAGTRKRHQQGSDVLLDVARNVISVEAPPILQHVRDETDIAHLTAEHRSRRHEPHRANHADLWRQNLRERSKRHPAAASQKQQDKHTAMARELLSLHSHTPPPTSLASPA